MGLKSTDEGLGNTLSDSLANALLAAGCQVVERTHLMNIAGANEVAVLESRGGADVLRIGQLANVDFIIVGSVNSQGQLAKNVWTGDVSLINRVEGAAVRLVDAKTAVLVTSVTYQPGTVDKWHDPVVVGEEIAYAILHGAARNSQ
jgi:curli biogenesis system outer membrane secretion channel CsgG